MRKPQPIRLGVSHRRWLAVVFGVLWASGVVWLVFHFFLRTEGEFGPRPHALEVWSLRLHALAAFAALVAIGSVLPVHARRAWELRKNRVTGLVVKTIFAWLSCTAYVLYYFADAEVRPWLPWLHWVVGIFLPVVFVLHVGIGRGMAWRRRVGAGREQGAA